MRRRRSCRLRWTSCFCVCRRRSCRERHSFPTRRSSDLTWGLSENQLQTGRETTRVALILCELAAGVALDPRRRAGAALGQGTVDHCAPGSDLVDNELKIGGAGAWEVLGAPFDVERLAAG